ncbi:MAG: class I SAM-dependent methyltransferase [Chloroflexota bacterium]
MWDKRYSADEYAFGKEPNEFLAENYGTIPKGKVLSLAEGEGHNAVFLAKQGYAVTAVDGSQVGLDKARRLAEEKGVEIECVHADLVEFDLGVDQWDGIVSIYFPLPAAQRTELYRKVVAGLKPNGVFLVEAYRPEQIEYGTGGGKSPETMTTKESLLQDLNALKFIHLMELERNVVEGKYHTGLAAVVQAIAKKVDKG